MMEQLVSKGMVDGCSWCVRAQLGNKMDARDWLGKMVTKRTDERL